MAERFSCARNSSRLAEPLLGTASQETRWVLVEQPGAWGADALRQSALPGEVAEELLSRCRRLGARPLLIRRRGGRADGRRRVYVAGSAPEGGWLRRFDLDDVTEVLDLDLEPLADDVPVGGEPVTGPLLLTCTNGRHDACCAEFGRGVAAVLDEAFDERAWECSHIGGDRFAANVLCLPEGVYYGRVTAAAAVGIGHLHDAGLLSLPHYRGRSLWPFDVQAAETLLRAHLGIDGIADVRPVDVARPASGECDVDLLVGEVRWRVALEVASETIPQQLTCGASRLGRPPRYTATSMAPAPPPGEQDEGWLR